MPGYVKCIRPVKSVGCLAVCLKPKIDVLLGLGHSEDKLNTFMLFIRTDMALNICVYSHRFIKCFFKGLKL